MRHAARYGCAILLVSGVRLASAAPAIQCTVKAETAPYIRVEGITELTGDLVLECTGRVPTGLGQPIPTYTITATLNGVVTSRLVSSNLSEALLLIDDPWPAQPF